MRLAYYAGASTAAAAACLLKAFHQRPNYYSATVYLSQSNACLLILTNLCLVLACGFMYALQRLLYGPLRPIEIEQLSEKAWYAVLDTLLAMPSFREDVGGWLLTMFVLLLAGKVWGWIGEGRVDILEQQPPANPRLFHARLSTSLVLSVFFDMYMLNYCVETVLADPRPGMMVIFTFEFAIQSIFSTFTLCRYGLTVAETMIVKKQTEQAIEVRKNEIRAERAEARQNEASNGDDASAVPSDTEPIEVDEQEVDVPGWEDKRRYLFVLEVVTDFIKLFIYMFFFAVSITFNGLPMHIMRDVYMTFASFSKRVTDYVAYRKATSDMNTRYPDATTEEIRGDACIVCRESMVSWNTAEIDPPPDGQGEQAAPPPPTRRRDEGLRAKKLPCGHILHLRCLKAWLERQQVCPTCRRPVVTATSPNTPNAPAQIQGQGARQEPQGQQGNQQPAAPRPNRARIFNLGPIRVGLLNAPNAQLQNIVDQLRNPDAANQNAVAPANPEGANNTGLRAPNTDGQSTQQNSVPTTSTARGSSRGRRANIPIQIQLMQIEQRLVQEAHNLGIEQQQLATLRMLEAELARLRANHIPSQPAVGVQRPPIHQVMQGSVMSPFQATQAPQLMHSQPSPEILHGQSTMQYNSGDEGLPSGLVLPEGWSIMPLQRIGGNSQASQSIGAQTIRSESTQPLDRSLPTQSTLDASNTLPVDPAATIAEATAPPSEPLSAQSAAPTNENGSPLFVPTAMNAGDNATLGDQTRPNAPESSGTAEDEPRTLWAADEGWGFTNHPEQTNTSQPGGTQANSEHTVSQSEQQYSGKGKGKAVEVEDASDAEAGS